MSLPYASASSLGLNGIGANTNVASQQANLSGTPAPTSNTALSNAGTTGYQIPSPNLPTFNISPSGKIVQNSPSGASSSSPVASAIANLPIVDDKTAQKYGFASLQAWRDATGRTAAAQAPQSFPPPAPLPPVLPPGVTAQAKSASGATVLPQATMGGTTGSSVTPVSSPLGSLQLPGLNLGASPTSGSSASMTPKLPTQNNISPQLINQLVGTQQANTPQTSQTSKATFPPLTLGAQQGEGTPIAATPGKLGGSTESSPGASVIPSSWAMNALLGVGGLGAAALTGGALLPAETAMLPEAENLINELAPEAENIANSSLPKTLGNIAGGIGTVALGSKIINPNSADATFDMSKTGAQRLTDTQGNPTTTFNQANAQGNITDQNLQKTAITSAVRDPSKIQTVASQIANQQGLQTIISMQDQAQKTGDMKSVISLANIHTAVTQQLQLIDQIGRTILAQAQGFGTQNAPGVTAARMPMVQQGVGQALTSTPTAPSTLPNQTGSNAASTLIPHLHGLTSNQVQQQKPTFPTMG